MEIFVERSLRLHVPLAHADRSISRLAEESRRVIPAASSRLLLSDGASLRLKVNVDYVNSQHARD